MPNLKNYYNNRNINSHWWWGRKGVSSTHYELVLVQIT
jgi:hypothetical protein